MIYNAVLLSISTQVEGISDQNFFEATGTPYYANSALTAIDDFCTRRGLGKAVIEGAFLRSPQGIVNLVELAAAEMIDWLLRAGRGWGW